MDEAGKAIILGASSGIGKEMALWLAGNGWRVGITGRREQLLDTVVAAFPERIVASAFDADDTDALVGRLDTLASRLGGLDLLVVSAGCGFLNPELEPAPELATVATNVASFTVSAGWGFKYFRRQGHGRLAAITSVAGLLGEAAAPAYPASKAYQLLYLAGLRKLAKKEKLQLGITELRPGPVRTDMMKGEGHFWISSPEAAAELACRAILKGKKLQYISKRWAALGVLLRLFSLSSHNCTMNGGGVMETAEHQEVAKLYRRLAEHCSPDTAAAIARGVSLPAFANDGDKAVWVRHVVAALDEALPAETIRSVRLGCHCDEEGKLGEMKRWLGGLYRESAGIEDFVEKVNAFGAGWYMEDGWICTKFLTCECYMLRAVDRLPSASWCLCTEGYTRELFRHVLGCEVESELVQTIKMGHDFCLVRIRKARQE